MWLLPFFKVSLTMTGKWKKDARFLKKSPLLSGPNIKSLTHMLFEN